eukprot:2924767-Rhodomonas_salina.1
MMKIRKQCTLLFRHSVAAALVLMMYQHGGMLGAGRGVHGCPLGDSMAGTCAAYDFGHSSQGYKNGQPYATPPLWVDCPPGECLAGKYLKTDERCFREHRTRRVSYGVEIGGPFAQIDAPFTIVMKVKASTLANSPFLLDMSHSDSSRLAWLQFYITTAGQVVFRFLCSKYRGVLLTVTSGSTLLPLDVWTHIAVRASGDVGSAVRFNIFINGTSVSGERYIKGMTGYIIQPNRLGIGCRSNNGNRLAGYIADFLVYDSALSNDHISERAAGRYLESNLFARGMPTFFKEWNYQAVGWQLSSMPCMNAVCQPVDECATSMHNCAVPGGTCTDTLD